ncbi:MAG: hypothetical protein FJ088_03205, partial [Deltaproteobacteria bacterium]|nr:hypothetical protein [Deltaproteobacteria bacterium]
MEKVIAFLVLLLASCAANKSSNGDAFDYKDEAEIKVFPKITWEYEVGDKNFENRLGSAVFTKDNNKLNIWINWFTTINSFGPQPGCDKFSSFIKAYSSAGAEPLFEKKLEEGVNAPMYFKEMKADWWNGGVAAITDPLPMQGGVVIRPYFVILNQDGEIVSKKGEEILEGLKSGGLKDPYTFETLLPTGDGYIIAGNIDVADDSESGNFLLLRLKGSGSLLDYKIPEGIALKNSTTPQTRFSPVSLFRLDEGKYVIVGQSPVLLYSAGAMIVTVDDSLNTQKMEAVPEAIGGISSADIAWDNSYLIMSFSLTQTPEGDQLDKPAIAVVGIAGDTLLKISFEEIYSIAKSYSVVDTAGFTDGFLALTAPFQDDDDYARIVKFDYEGNVVWIEAVKVRDGFGKPASLAPP